MAVCNSPVLFILLLSCFTASSHSVTFSSLQRTLIVNASPSHGQVLKAGEDNITVTWRLNSTYGDSSYKTIKVKLCYAPISQQDRAWRKTADDLQKDKTCQFKIVTTPYGVSGNGSGSSVWTVDKGVPTATYFVRAYVHDSSDRPVGYGQSTDSRKITNLFGIRGVSGRHVSLDIASVCFSAFSVVSLFGFFFLEKRKSKAIAMSQEK